MRKEASESSGGFSSQTQLFLRGLEGTKTKDYRGVNIEIAKFVKRTKTSTKINERVSFFPFHRTTHVLFLARFKLLTNPVELRQLEQRQDRAGFGTGAEPLIILWELTFNTQSQSLFPSSSVPLME